MKVSERIKEIKERTPFGDVSVDYIHQEDFDWLIEQTESVEVSEKEVEHFKSLYNNLLVKYIESRIKK